MAYMDQKKKAIIKAEIDKVLDKKMGWKYSLTVSNHSTLNFNVLQGPIDVLGALIGEYADQSRAEGYVDINPYWAETQLAGEELEVVQLLIDAMNTGNHDNSDIQTDYFDVGHYIHVSFGGWNRPYVYLGEKKAAA